MTLEPTIHEVKRWIVGVTTHALHIEYFLNELQVGKDDPQRPHDIVGEGNKFEWEVIRGFALGYRDRSDEFFQEHVMPSLQRHRVQYHHQKFNPAGCREPDAMKLGAVDAICGLMEPDREYQGGVHTYDEIIDISKANPAHKRPWMLEMIPEMRKIAQPDLSLVTDLGNIPNFGVPAQMYDVIVGRVQETLVELAERGYDISL